MSPDYYWKYLPCETRWISCITLNYSRLIAMCQMYDHLALISFALVGTHHFLWGEREHQFFQQQFSFILEHLNGVLLSGGGRFCGDNFNNMSWSNIFIWDNDGILLYTSDRCVIPNARRSWISGSIHGRGVELEALSFAGDVGAALVAMDLRAQL